MGGYLTKQEQEFKRLLETADEGCRVENSRNCRVIKVDERTPYRYHMIKGGVGGKGMLAGITDDVYEALKFLIGG